VVLISDESAPNVARLGEQAAGKIRGWLAELGVELELGTAVDRIERAGNGLRVHAGDRASVSGVVIMATGVSSRSELAAMAGAGLDGAAIAADASLRTSLPAISAAGDVCAAVNAAAGRRLHIEHWGDALGQGEIAGRVAAGEDTQWADVPGFWSTIGQRTLKYAAWGDGYSDARFEPAENGAFTVWYGQSGLLVGVLAHENDDAYERGRELIKNGAPWS
jgi:NADPH-dependent 2,4-dienoyl-CoA reductase/sulfur reductase-like enzyme